MKKWLIPLVGLTLVLAAIAGAGFALVGNESDNADQDVADEWKLVEASGWTGGFSLRLPRRWQLNELQGIDSYVGEIVGDGARFTFDFGWYSSSLAQVDDDDPQYIVTYEEIGRRQAKLVLPRGEGDGLMTGVYFEDFDSDLDIPSQNRLQITGFGLTPDQQETALAIFPTIRPLASDSQPIGLDETGTIEPSFGKDEPYLVPDRDVNCGSDQSVAITSDGQASCLDIAPNSGGDQDMVSPGRPPSVSPGQPPIIDTSPPVMGLIAPNLRLMFKGMEYTGVEILGAASPMISGNDITGPIVCCGTPINSDDMEVAGSGTRHNPDGEDIVYVYRPKASVTTDVHTFTPAQTFQVTEEPDEADNTPATWIRWTAS